MFYYHWSASVQSDLILRTILFLNCFLLDNFIALHFLVNTVVSNIECHCRDTYSIIKQFFKDVRKLVPDFTLFNCKWTHLPYTPPRVTVLAVLSLHILFIKSFSSVPLSTVPATTHLKRWITKGLPMENLISWKTQKDSKWKLRALSVPLQ